MEWHNRTVSESKKRRITEKGNAMLVLVLGATRGKEPSYASG